MKIISSSRVIGLPVILILCCVCALILASTANSEGPKTLSAERAKEAIRMFDVGFGGRRFNYQLGRETESRYLGSPALLQAVQSGQAKPKSMISDDFNGDGMGDLVIGYAENGGGILGIRRGNLQAIAPSDPSVFQAITQGRYPSPFLPEVTLYQLPEAPDFLQFGDFNSDGYADVMTAARGGQRMYLLPGDGHGNLGAAQSIDVPGLVTEMRAATEQLGTFTQLAVGLFAPGEARLAVYNETQALISGPETYSMAGEVTALAFDQLDGDGITDLAAASSSEVVVVYGRASQSVESGSLESAAARPALIERQNLPFAIRGLATGDFAFDRNHQREIAVLSAEGTVYLSARGTPDTRPFTKEEMQTIGNLRRSFLQDKIDMQTLTAGINRLIRPNRAAGWNVAETIPGGSAYTGTGKPLFQTSKATSLPIDDLLMGDGINNKVQVVRNERDAAKLNIPRSDASKTEVSVAGAPIAAVSMRLGVNVEPGMVLLGANEVEPTVVILAPNALFTVNSTADLPDLIPTAANGVCAATGGVCTLRAAIMQSNHTGGSNTIMVPDNTYTLTLGPPDDEFNTGGATEQSGDLDIFSWDLFDGSPILTAVSITGGTRDGCIIQMGTLSPTLGTNVPNNKERILEVNDVVVIGSHRRIAVTLTNLTLQNGFSPTGSGNFLEGGAIYYDGSDLANTNIGLLTLTNVKLSANTSAGQGGGVWAGFGSLTVNSSSIVRANTATNQSTGGVAWTGGNTVETQGLTIANSTIGGALVADGNQATDPTFGAPGGVDARGGLFVTISGTTIQNNIANTTATTIGGGGIQINSPTVAISTSTISANKSKGNAGGIYSSARNAVTNAASTLTLTTVNVTGNQADSDNTGGGNGGGIFNFFGTATIQTTSHVDGNSADNGGGIFNAWTNIAADPTAGLTVQSGSTIGQAGAGNGNSAKNNGGSIAIQQTGATTFGPITLNSLTFTNNTANSDSAGGGDGGAIFISAGTITSLNNCTFDSNVANSGTGDGIRQTGGTINGAGTLNFNGGESISITGGTFTSTSGALNLSGNLSKVGGTFAANGGTVNCNGTSAQFIGTDAFTFNNLTINNSAGVTLTGSDTVSGTLTLTSGVLSIGTTTLTLTGPVSFTSGTIGSSPTGTVNYNQAAANQNVAPGSYGNLFFNNFVKVLPNSGTVGIAGTFTPGSATPTVTGSTVDFNAAGAQTVPALNYNNLTISGNRGGATVTLASPTIGVAGVFNPSATNVAYSKTGNTFAFNGGGTQTVPTFDFNNLTISNTHGANAVTLVNGGTIGVADTFTAGTSTFVTTGNTVNFNGAITQTIPVFNFNNLMVSNTHGANAVTLVNGGTIAVAGTFTPGTSTFTIANNTMDFNGAGAQTIPAFNYHNLTTSGNRGGAAITFASGNIGIASTFSPAATNNTYSTASNTVIFNGAVAQTVPAFTFNGLTLNNAAGANLGGSVTVGGALTLTAGALGVGANTLTLNGAASATGGSLTSGTTGTVIYNQGSNGQATVLAANYGNLTFSNFSKTLAGSGTIGIAGTFTPGTSVVAHTITGSTINFNGAGAQAIPGFTYQNLTSSGGAVARTLDSVNTIKIAGVFTPGTNAYTITSSTIEYNGTGIAQSLPATFTPYNNLTLNNAAGTTGFAGLAVNGLIEVKAGTFTSSSTYKNVQIDSGATLAASPASVINVSGSWTNNGTFTAGTGLVNFNGLVVAQTIGGSSVTTFNNLTNSNDSGITLAVNTNVNGILALDLSDITTGAFTLTQPATGSSSGGGDVNGSVQRTGFTTGGAALSFGNPFNTIQVTAGTAPANIMVDLKRTVPNTAGQGFPNAVQRTYTITPNTSVFTATVRLHYLAPELNGNDPTLLNLWRFDSVISQWRPNPATSRDCAAGCTTNNSNFWAERAGVTQFSAWTLNSTTAPTAAPATISGRITDVNGVPAGGATIDLSGGATRATITDTNGNYHFDNLDTGNFYTVTPSLANYHFSPANRSFSLVGNQTNAGFTANPDATQTANAIDSAEFFVRQQYLDFLGREPDQGGLEFWSSQINLCGADSNCIGQKRIDVSAAFFISGEFEQTGSYVYDMYAGLLGRTPGYGEFTRDRVQVVGGSGLDPAKTAFAEAFVQRSEFTSSYPASLSREHLVDAVLQTMQERSGIDLSSQRDGLLADYDNGGRALVARHAAESTMFVNAEYNKAFVLMEYFGYLRRGEDTNGYVFWLNALNQGESYRGMVCSFLTSAEYQRRFSSVQTHSNAECGN